MVGAISFLQDAIKICDSRAECEGCPCELLCRQKKGVAVLPTDTLSMLVGNVRTVAAGVSEKLNPAKAVYVTRYNVETSWEGDPGNGGEQSYVFVAQKEESVRIPAREVDAFLTCKCDEFLKRYCLTEKDRVPCEPFEEMWDDGLYRVCIRRTKGAVYPVSDRTPGSCTWSGLPHENYHASLTVSMKLQNGYYWKIIEYIPESERAIHERR